MGQLPGTLIIGRHGESEWNARGIWTGLTDVHLTAHGHEQAAQLGELLVQIPLHQAFASEQIRTHETLDDMLQAAGQAKVPVSYSSALNERDYGDYTGKNKWEVKELIGEQAFQQLRRGWDFPVPGGETLKQVYARSLPFYDNTLLPVIAAGQTVLIVAHGNSIRSLQKYIENIPDSAIGDVEMVFGSLLVYRLDEAGRSVGKTVLQIQTTAPPA